MCSVFQLLWGSASFPNRRVFFQVSDVFVVDCVALLILEQKIE